MEIAIKIAQFILSFSLLIFIHELGHFLFARLFGIRVEKFYLFFNPWFSLFKFNYKGTEYGFGWIPFGGYVKIAGMIDESMDTEQMKQPAKPDEFRSKPAWQRLLVMVGGVLMNMILALIVYIGITYKWGDKFIDNSDVKHGYAFSKLAQEVGFRNGDIILSVNQKSYGNYGEIFNDILLNPGSQVEVLRGDSTLTVVVDEDFTSRLIKDQREFMAPRLPFVVAEVSEASPAQAAGVMEGDIALAIDSTKMLFIDQYSAALDTLRGTTATMSFLRDSSQVVTLPVAISESGKIGVALASPYILLKISSKEYTFAQAIPAGVKLTGSKLSGYWKQVKMIFSPKTEAYKSLGGVIAIGSIFPTYWSWEAFWSITAFLSIILAVMNILPIPALDGGHVLFLLYEVITRRTPSDKFLERAQMVGIIILFALLIYANGNDIYRFFIK